MAVDVLISRGVPESRILFLNLIASPEGIDGFAKRFPKLRVVTAFIDQVSQMLSIIATDPVLTLLLQGLDEKK
jgi:uracil phosphoribosyltransferase